MRKFEVSTDYENHIIEADVMDLHEDHLVFSRLESKSCVAIFKDWEHFVEIFND